MRLLTWMSSEKCMALKIGPNVHNNNPCFLHIDPLLTKHQTPYELKIRRWIIYHTDLIQCAVMVCNCCFWFNAITCNMNMFAPSVQDLCFKEGFISLILDALKNFFKFFLSFIHSFLQFLFFFAFIIIFCCFCLSKIIL